MNFRSGIIAVNMMCLLFSIPAFSHGDLSYRIAEKTKEISKSPKKAILYFQRGFLYEQHLEYKKALKDYDKSKVLGYQNQKLLFRKANTLFRFKKYNKALKEINDCLQKDQLNVKTYKLKAKILHKMERHSEALQAYKYVLEHVVDPKPEDYINYCDILLAINKEDYKEALHILNLGKEKLGKNTAVFQLRTIAYLKQLGKEKEVLDYYNELISQRDRKEFLYYEKAKYLITIGAKNAAEIALIQAKLEIDDLKPKFKNTSAIQNLLTNINKLESL